jgi:hypothetical protein
LIQAKSNFHPLGEKAKSRERRNKRRLWKFELVKLRMWGWRLRLDKTTAHDKIYKRHLGL